MGLSNEVAKPMKVPADFSAGGNLPGGVSFFLICIT